jgi:periplasmic divalent cation tolerance protein
MPAFFVYVTARDADEATRIGRALVQSRLAACANVHAKITSIYRWQGELCEDTEAVLIAKTREALVAPLIEKVKALHSYDCPCVVALPVTDGNPDFLAWIEDETREAGS